MTWNLKQLETLLIEQNHWSIRTENDCLCVSDEADLEAYVALSGEQILVSTILFAKEHVADTTGLNEEILRTHHILPLTSIGLTAINNKEYYMAFGALSSQSTMESIIIEIETLFCNVEAFLDAYSDYLK